MAEFDFGGALTSLVQNAGSYFIQQQQLKQAAKIASRQAQLPQLGMGYGGMAPQPRYPGMMYGYGASSSMPVPYNAPSMPADLVIPGLGQLSDYLKKLGLGGDSGGGGTSTVGPYRPEYGGEGGTGQPVRYRRPSISQDAYGRLSRPLGRPLLWSGDLAAFKRVRKIAGKLRRYASHSRFR